MRQKILYIIWGCLYILCVGLGTLTNRSEAGSWILTVIALLFYVPGGILLYDSLKANDRVGLIRIRVISLCSLVLTMVLLVANIASVKGSVELGNALYDILLLVSAPMLCSKWWALTLFALACMLFISFPRLWRSKPKKKLKG